MGTSTFPGGTTETWNDLSVLTTRGDLVYGSSGSPKGTRLGIGGANTHINSDGTDVAWAANETFAGLSPLTTRGDILLATSGTTTGTRLAVGGATEVLTSDGTDAAWSAAGGGASKKYTATLAECTNTTTPTAIISWTVPANEWSDGERLYLRWSTLQKQNTGGDRYSEYDAFFGSESFEVNLMNGATSVTSNNVNEIRAFYAHEFIRVGSEIWCFCGGLSPHESVDWPDFNMPGRIAKDNGAGGAYHWISVVASSADFTASLACSITVNHSTADATYYVKPQTCSIIKTEGSAA